MDTNINGVSFNVEKAQKYKTFEAFYEAYKGMAYTHYKNGREIAPDTQKQLLRDAYSILCPQAKEDKPKK